MYTVYDYGRMIADEVRMRAYVSALERHVKPGCVVVDLGAGTGIFSLVAAKLGARKVYAIESNDAVLLLPDLARENGVADKIEVRHAESTEVHLPERADVMVSDLRGGVPLFGRHLPTVMDARARFLAPGGAQIPARDHLVVAGVEAPELFARVVSPWSDAPMRLSLTAARDAVVNWMHADTDHPIQPGQLVTEPCRWATLDYSTLSSPSASGRAALSATRSTKAHGLAVWFEAELDQLAKYSTGPGSQRVYGRAFFPFPTAVDIEAGDVVTVDLQATWAGDRYLWGWQTQVASPGSAPRASFRQSTFLGTPFSLEQLRRDLPTHRPVLSARGECDRAVLGWMDGSRTLGDLATRLHHTHPTIAASDADAMAHVRRLVRQCAK